MSLNTIYYTTRTVYVDGRISEDKGLYMQGQEHAEKCCKERLLAHPEIDFIVLIPDNGFTLPYIIHH